MNENDHGLSPTLLGTHPFVILKEIARVNTRFAIIRENNLLYATHVLLNAQMDITNIYRYTYTNKIQREMVIILLSQ